MKENSGHINVSVANCYASATYESEIVTQALLGEQADILERADKFIRIRQQDNYESWIDRQQISEGVEHNEHTGASIVVRSHFARIYSEPDLFSLPVKDAVIGCTLLACDENDGWYRVNLPSGENGWIEKKNFNAFPDFSREGVVKLALEFAGYQYFWGGKTPKGFDCSGFTQLVYSLSGPLLPRDAWMQKADGPHFSKNFQDAGASDLLFFGKEKSKVTHVGISLGDGRVIHASDWVKISSLIEGAPDYDQELVRNFISVNRYIR